MASRFQKNGIWYVRAKGDDGKWKNISCGPKATANEAKDILAIYIARELNRRHHAPIRTLPIPLPEALKEFVANELPRSEIGRDKAASSIKKEVGQFAIFERWLADTGNNDFSRISTETIELYLDWRKSNKMSDKTRHEDRRVISKFFKWCSKRRYFVKENLFIDIPNPKPTPRKAPVYFSEAELEKIFKALKEPYRSICQFLYLTGMRAGELTNLEWSDWHEPINQISIRVMEGNKTKRPGHLPLSEGAREVLQRLKKEPRETTDGGKYIFVRATKKKLDTDDIYRALKPVLTSIGLPDRNVHTFRHTCASHLVIKGVSLYVVKEILRHASIKETEVYAHLSKEAVSNALAMLRVAPSTVSPLMLETEVASQAKQEI